MGKYNIYCYTASPAASVVVIYKQGIISLMIKFLVSLLQYMMTITFRNHEFSPGYFQDKEKKMKIVLTCMHIWIIK